MIQLNGIFPPLPTSFNQDEELALVKMKENITRLSQFELAGFLILGSNGELVHLSKDEKQKIYEGCREAISRDKLMIAGTGGQSTKETIHLTKIAARAGADAALVLNPSYYKGLMTTEALKAHFFDVAESSTIPVIIYNMPANSGLDMDANTILELSSHPNIIGVKDSGGNLTKMGEIRFKAKPEFQILAGSAGFLLPALTIGAIGGILALANIAPDQCIQVYQHFLDRELEDAKHLQIRLVPVNTAVTRKWGVPALKEAMDQIGLYGGPSRKPLLPVKEDIKTQLTQLLSQNNINPIK